MHFDKKSNKRSVGPAVSVGRGMVRTLHGLVRFVCPARLIVRVGGESNEDMDENRIDIGTLSGGPAFSGG